MTLSRSPLRTLYPLEIDDQKDLYLVHNQAENMIVVDLEPEDDELVIEQTDRTVWSDGGGLVSINDEVMSYAGTYVEEFPSAVMSIERQTVSLTSSPLDLERELVVDSVTTSDVGFSNVIASGRGYTVVGSLFINDRLIQFSVRGDGKHLRGAIFRFSDPSPFEPERCWINTAEGKLFFSVLAPFYTVEIAQFKEPTRSPVVQKLVGLTRKNAQFHPAGSFVRGFIFAEHHNALVDAILRIESLVGVDDSDDPSSLDFRLSDLRDQCVETDDYRCPTGEVRFSVVDEDECHSFKTVHFSVDVQGDYDEVELFFGDGSSVVNQLEVDHNFPANAKVDPQLTIRSDRCATITSIASRSELRQIIPEVIVPSIVCPELIIPDIPSLPQIVAPEIPDPIPSLTVEITQPDGIFEPPVQDPISFAFNAPDDDLTTDSTAIGPVSHVVNLPELVKQAEKEEDPPPVAVVFTVDTTQGPPSDGPCFALVPCGSPQE